MSTDFHVARYVGIFDNHPIKKRVTWAHFCHKLATPLVRTRKEDCILFSPTKYFDNINGLKKKGQYKNAKGRTFFEYTDDHGNERITNDKGEITRSNKNVESVSMLVFDFDTGNADPSKIIKPWSDYNLVVHSTWSHSRDKGKYRLIVPLKKPLSPSDFKNIWEDVSKIAGEVDKSCKDASRMFYWPSHKPENSDIHYYHAVTDRKFYAPKIKKPVQQVLKKTKTRTKRGDYTTLDVVRWFKDHGFYIGPGNKNGQHWVKCPWEDEHNSPTKMEDTFIFEGEGNWPTFHCSHNTCNQNERNIQHLIKLWGDADQYCTRLLTRDSVKTDTVIKCLGYDDAGNYYYQSAKTNHVTRLKPESHKELNFYSISSDINYWYKHWGKEENGRVDWKAAARDMMAKCHDVGFFKPTSVRGSGCWIDENRMVAHMGDYLKVKDQKIALTEFKSNYIYESAVQKLPWKDPLPVAQAFEFAQLIDQLPIPNDLERFLFSGHTVASILSGCLAWRPHVWLTGDAGSGKTTILNSVLNALWMPIGGIFCEGRTTESGVRQKVRHNAVPIILDEVEANSKDESIRVEALLAMARSASSNSNADVAKGTISGHGQSFLVKSCFTFSSIVDSLQWAQDKERFLLVNVQSSDSSKRNWPHLRRNIQEMMTSDFSFAFFARAISKSSIILENCDIFHQAIVETFPKATSRNADQVSTHAACAWSLRSDKILSVDQALTVLDKYGSKEDWSRFWQKEETSHGNNGLNRILTKLINCDNGKSSTIGQLVWEITDPQLFGVSTEGDENKILGRFGMKVDKNYFWIAKDHTELKRLFFQDGNMNWYSTLKQLPGAQIGYNTISGIKINCVGVPLDYVFRDKKS